MFHTLKGHVIMPLTNPGVTLVITRGTEALWVVAIERSHKEKLIECKEWRVVTK